VDGARASVAALAVQVQLHFDIVSSLEFCVRSERTLLLSSSSDCTVQLYDVITKSLIGVFGQVCLCFVSGIFLLIVHFEVIGHT